MTEMLETVAVGDRVAVLLPDEVRARLGVRAGDPVNARVLAAGLGAGEDVLARTMAIAERLMDKHADALAVLAR